MTTVIMNGIVSTMKILRVSQDKTQGGLAELCGLSQSGISQIERKVRKPSLREMKLISQGLGVSPTYVFDAVEYPKVQKLFSEITE